MKKMYSSCICDECGIYLDLQSILIPFRYSTVCSKCYQNLVKKPVDLSEDEDSDDEDEELSKVYEVFCTAPLMNPKEIVTELNEYVIGQVEAKKTLAVAAYNHYYRTNRKELGLKKSNILLYGPSGSGKTYLIRKLAEILEVPMVIADASVFTEAGYRGAKAEGVIVDLFYAADGNKERTEQGIVFLDEFDKLSSRYGHYSHSEANVGAGVQRQLLKLIEGTTVKISKENIPKSIANVFEPVLIDTSNILFICGGAFVGLGKKEHNEMHQIGFDTASIKENEEPMEETIDVDSFIQFGIIPELLGRLPVIVKLEELTEEDICKVLEESGESIIDSYRTYFDGEGIELVFEKEAVREIARQAYKRGLGARGIQTIMEKVMQPLIYNVLTDPCVVQCVVTEAYVRGTEEPYMLKDLDEVEDGC